MASRQDTTRVGAATLPSMTVLLETAGGDPRFSNYPIPEIKAALTDALIAARTALRSGETANAETIDVILANAAERLARQRRAMVGRVINATGIVLHTGLGRAPLAQTAVDAVVAAAGYCNLEFDMETGERGRRGGHVEDMLRRLTGAEAALVVNNNAAATLLVLMALANGREAIVSRGQLIEIGGSFRLPDVMACSGCVMREVGTTNKTRLSDYEAAINERTAMLLHVHTSNYRVEGFAETPDTAALVGLARRSAVSDQRPASAQCPVPSAQSESVGWVIDPPPVPPRDAPTRDDQRSDAPREGAGGSMTHPTSINPKSKIQNPKSHPILIYDDLGSGAMLDDDLWRAASEPTVPASLAAGADVVSFSGDKLLGGPQAGIILGRSDVVERLRKHPMARALRVDKLTVAALQATLSLYFEPGRAMREIPALRMLKQPIDELRRRAETLRGQLAAALPDHAFSVAESEAFAGGGSLPAWPLPTAVVRWRPPAPASATRLLLRLRRGSTPLIARIERDAVLFDARTLSDEILPAVTAACREAAAAQ